MVSKQLLTFKERPVHKTKRGDENVSTTVLLRKDRIVRMTIEVMNEQGVQAVSTKEIARREGITEGTIYKHFPQKKDLIISVLNYYEQIGQEIFDTIDALDRSPTQKILSLVEKTATCYEENPEITAISQGFNELYYNQLLEMDIKRILQKRDDYVIGLLQNAKSQKEIKNELDIFLMSGILIGTFRESCLQWRMRNYDFSLRERCILQTELLLNAFRT